jgi:hypothetical protein
MPRACFQSRLQSILSTIGDYDVEYLRRRVDYYNKLDEISPLSTDAIKLKDLKPGKNGKVYFFDSYEVLRYFNENYRAHFCFGDITYVPDKPSIVKSRPVGENNQNSVILKLSRIRHYIFVKDKRPFSEKQDLLVGRSNINQLHRARFMEMYFNHPLCDVGGVGAHTTNYPYWIKPRLTIEDHLKYKFILCLEGYDVASNLKWVMSSNSLAVMPKPKYESWFMEGTLIPDYHYVQIKDDYSDLEEKLTYYITHPDEAQQIVNHAHDYVKPFQNKKQERLISLLVFRKYLQKTGQLDMDYLSIS